MGRNTEVEARAIELVLAYEKENEPVAVHKAGLGYDVKCRDKVIEVKGSTEKSLPFVTLNHSNIKALREHDNFYIYVVYDLNDEPKLVILDKTFIEQEGKERVSIEVPLRKAQYDVKIVL